MNTEESKTDALVTVIDSTGRFEPPRVSQLTRHLEAAALALGLAGEVRVRIIADTEMDAAHRRYSGVDGTTDVLTFDLRSDPAAPLDTDLLVCLDEADRQGADRGWPADRELLLYCLHGILHCLGYDDHDDHGFARMHAEEDRILDAIGVGRTYAPGNAEAAR